MHHRDGGSDPTELVASAQPALNRPTGACHTNQIILPQPVMCGMVERDCVGLNPMGPCRSGGAVAAGFWKLIAF